jgi:tetratricopeptide (TPR) repeat protein
LRPDAPVVDYWLGRLFDLTRRPEKAIAAWQAAIESSKTHLASRVELGRIFYERGDLNSATAPLKGVIGDFQALASIDERATAYHLMGMIYAARQQSDESIKALSTALSIDVSRSSTIQALAEQYMGAEKYQEALNFFTTNKNLGAENPDVMLGIVRAYMGLEKWDEAIAQLQRGAKLFPNDARFPLYLGRLHRERVAYFDAKKALKQALDINPNLLSAHAALAQLIWITDQDHEKADPHIAAIEARPERIDASVGTEVAKYYQMSRRSDLAEKWYAATLKRHPNYWPARLALARMYLDNGQNEKALALLERARAEGVKDLRLSAYLADAYRQSRHFAKAVDQINNVIARHPDNKEYIFIRGRIYFDQGNYDNARQDFIQAYELDPQFHQAYFFLGRTAFEQGDFTKAMKIFRHVLDYKPNVGEFRYWMGRSYEAENRLTSALGEYRKATVVDEGYGLENPAIFVRRGELLSRLGYSQQGKQDIARALEIDPKMVEALVAMGESNFRDKLYRDAIENFESALKLAPKLAQVQYKLGMSLMYIGKELEGAEHLQLAVRYGYEDPEIFQTLGYLYKRMNKKQAAIDSFKEYLTRIATKKAVPVETKREMIRQIKELGGRF